MAKYGSLEYLLVWMPAAVGEQLYHVALRAAGYQTVPLDPKRGDAAAQIGDLRAVDVPPGFVGELPIDKATLEKWNIE